jgi:tetratricopeptide (TPR) repeat protein
VRRRHPAVWILYGKTTVRREIGGLVLVESVYGHELHSPKHQHTPLNDRAYELYLRANDFARTYAGLARARDLYLRCLELDPRFAPAWARLGRCHRVIGKYVDRSTDSEAHAEEALRRALELNPRLSVAHKLYANLEADTGQAERAMLRLLGEANRHGNDPELFAGLVHACRYCGLLNSPLPHMPRHAGSTRMSSRASSRRC